MPARQHAAVSPSPFSRRPRLSLGQQVGRYILTEVLGSGAMGVVYRAHDTMLEREVALKSLHVEDQRSRRRFIQEARAMARLSHPNVVQVYDVVCVERPDGLGEQWLIAMELVHGQTLERWLALSHSWEEIRDVFVAAGRGLAAAHAAGLVHRDFKPANVLVDDRGQVKVTDFGLTMTAEERAPTLDGEGATPDERAMLATFPGTVVGTPAYMSPEQHRGDVVTPATDQFAFCAVLFEALFGGRPFDGRDCKELSRQKHLGERRPAKGTLEVPRWLRAVALRGLHPEASGRFRNMAALLAQLERPAPARRWPQLVAAALLVVVGTGLGVVWSPLQSAADPSAASASASALVASAAASASDSSSSASRRK